ncbi:Ldh family oxidoreductase [Antarcticirhabdus aurantiaca]|uniref:Ldh family oxidoreductase n=1 Tax=Antarcticirhabdus aurantiaca TaxID=2606717 RepID=A0ACD4NKK1_9HYPH|nr:Ldh family oxidoreductase [Antarcticirhabdus aurantiaca]WAJ27430.1 Ldh family oxidoreductase [Jeongeuplla avenae]
MDPIIVEAGVLARALEESLREAGASDESVEACVRALMHASLLGVDSHGARLVAHYCRVLKGGRVNPRPAVKLTRTGPAAAMLDGDDGLGHLTAYRAAEAAVEIARESGVGAVGATRSSHFGAAGAYARAIAEAGMVGFATTNADSIVALFGSAKAFHGTNPLAFAAPVAGASRPWLLDMATSSIPQNRVLLYRSLGRELPENVAADAAGVPTRDAQAAEMLLPLGGADYGFKGAALAGVATLFSAILTGATLDHAFIPMVGSQDIATPRGMGHFVLAIDPARFGGTAVFEAGMRAYLDALRASPAAEGAGPILAPGDREWAVEAERRANGVPIDPDTAAFLRLS